MNFEDLLQRIADSLERLVERLEVPTKPSCKYTLFDWIGEWFNTYRVPTLRDGGYDLRNNIEKHIKPNIENKPLDEYTAHDITKALSAVVSDRMRQIVRQIYNQCFREAARAGYIERNPVENVAGVRHSSACGKSLTRAEQAELLHVVADDRFGRLFRFYLLTGARPAEPLSVTWSDITSTTLHIPGTKTTLSDRTLPMTSKLRALLEEIPKTEDRLFPYSYRAVANHLSYRILPQLSFTFTLKDLRHTFGTRCLESGVAMKTVQKWLGHSNYGTTANIYSHITNEFEQQEVEKLDGSDIW